MPRRSLALVAFVLALHWHAAAALAQALPEDYRFAVGLYKQQRWPEAADAFKKFLSANPNHERAPYARLYLGLTFVNADKYADARTVLRDYVRDFPQSKNLPDAMYRVAECSYLLEDLKSAETEFEQFLARHADHDLAEWALPYLADTKLRLHKLPEARTLFERAIAKYPKGRLLEDSRFGLARTLEDLKFTDEAAKVYAALAAEPNGNRAPQSLMNLATIQFNGEKFEEAAKSFSRVAAEFPRSALAPSAHLNAGYSLFRLGQFDRAIEQFDIAAAEKSQSLVATYWKGVSLKSKGDFAKAIELLRKAYEANPKSSVAETALFYWADCELRLGHHDQARKLFLELVSNWSKGEYADDSLHFAAEAAMVAGALDDADKLLARFQKEYPDSLLRFHQSILRGRLLNAQAAAALKSAGGAATAEQQQAARKLREQAVALFETVIAQSKLPRTVTLARYHLGRVAQEMGDHARTVEALKPVIDKTAAAQSPQESVEALVVVGHSLHELGRHPEAISALTQYLAERPNGAQVEQALADRAVSHAAAGNRDAAAADIVALLTQFPKSSTGAETINRLAELAYKAQRWPDAADLFGKMAALGGKESELRRLGLSGLGWSRYQMKEYDAAAAAFNQVVDQYPKDRPQAVEAAYMRGRSLQEAKKIPEAAEAYAATFKSFAPGEPSPDDPARGALKNVYLAGVQSARMLADLKRYADSDAAYERVLSRFPKARDRDQVLFEWGRLHFDAGPVDDHPSRARDLLARLVKEYPDSPSTDDARLLLAELNVGAKPEEAAKDFSAILATGKADPHVREDALARVVALAVDRQDWPVVRDNAEKLLAEFKTSRHLRETQLYLASAQLGLKKPEEAEKTLQSLKQELTKDGQTAGAYWARVWVLLAEAYHDQKKYEAVESTVAELRQRMPNSDVLYQADDVLGRSYKNQAKWDKATEAFERVIAARGADLDETACKCQLMLGEIHFMRREFQQAKEAYLKVDVLYENLPQWRAPALFQVGKCEENLNQAAAAVKTYERLVQSFPNSPYAKDAHARLDELRKRSSS